MKRSALVGCLMAVVVVSVALFVNGCGSNPQTFTVHTSTSAN
jgi:hypothetical protein